jgi:uncharacterized repeat protein (TIGR01451 family)
MKKYFILIIAFVGMALLGLTQEERAFHFSPDTIPLPDGTGVSYTTSILVEGYIAGQTLNSLNEFLGVCVNMSHTYVGDLVISLTCPDQTLVILEAQGGDGCNLGVPPDIGYDYCWTINPENGLMSDEATNLVTLPGGSFTSYESLSNFIGCPLNGLWTITVTDNWAIDSGYIYNWGINFAANPGCFTMLTGRVYADINENNIFDDGDSPLPGVSLIAEPGPYYGISDSNGEYRIWVNAGTYSVSQIGPEMPWAQSFPDSPSYHIVEVLTDAYDTVSNLDFANYAEYYCPLLSVDVVLGELGICSHPLIHISYENNGTISSDNTIIVVELDDNITYQSGGNLISQDGNYLTFDVDTVAVGQSGEFSFYGNYSCDSELAGATACVGAHIYPDDLCGPIDEEWDRSSVMVEGECVDNIDVCFTITNTGDPGEGDMQGPSQYRIFEDNLLVFSSNFQIAGGETQVICWSANGNTIRLEADQRPGHPGNSHPNESVELCGSPNASVGQVLQVPQDDQDDFVEIDCQEVLASYDPNNKSVMPQGLTLEHCIDSTDVMEYIIRFQNTGTAPAQKIIITDTISQYLDVSKFNYMSSSHTCTVDILYSNIIRWTFEDIMLPDSNSNEPESHGYVKFKINQIEGNDIGTIITNSANIYFDYNLPVITNQVSNKVWKTEEIFTPLPLIYGNSVVNVYPNPANSYVVFEVDSEAYDIYILNLSGQIVQKTININSKEFKLQIDNLEEGIYFYQIIDEIGVKASGKLIIAD